jgi:TPR repeat protein
MAAQRGFAYSQSNLGVMYGKGLGVKQDMVQAQMWFILAANQGLEEGIKNRDLAIAKLDQSEIAEAEKLAKAWNGLTPF